VKNKSFLVVVALIACLIGLSVLWTLFPVYTTCGICWVTCVAIALLAGISFLAGRSERDTGLQIAAVMMVSFVGLFAWMPIDYYHLF